MTKQEHEAKFNDTVAILVKAYLNGTLEHQNCAACAVGNIIASKSGYVHRFTGELLHDNFYTENGCAIDPGWRYVFCSTGRGSQTINQKRYSGYAKEQIDSTGYSWGNLAKIELAFENMRDDESGFKGLMAVVDVLASIHGIDLSTADQAKALFVKA